MKLISRIPAPLSAILLLLCAPAVMPLPAAEWKPAEGRLMTRWAAEVSPDRVHPEYPRPLMVREGWQNLNGLWDYAIRPRSESKPARFDGQILVPFAIESALSGVMKTVGDTNRLWYHRRFEVPEAWAGKRTLLHFGAVDWEATVYVNGREIGVHRGGYDPFSFDITDALASGGEQELVVAVYDPTDKGPQPRGKQVSNPHGIWYTSVTGIWQTPWLEAVPVSSIESVVIVPRLESRFFEVTVTTRGETNRVTVMAVALDGSTQVAAVRARVGNVLRLRIPSPKLWTPDSPHLYDFRLSLMQGREVLDEVRSYGGMRSISRQRDEFGTQRLLLNGTIGFQYGPLDQGWWPDGLYTAPTDAALRYDLEVTKELGFNMVRKHVKVEPARWYYWCDKLGLLVWQDMPSGDQSAKWQGPSGFDGVEMQRTPESAAIYEKELKAMISGLRSHPSIVTWVPFNEGWGQFDTERIVKLTQELDPTRLVDGPSGGNHFPVGDMVDHHQYPGPGAPVRTEDRVMILGEFGGLGLPVAGHTWQDEKNWGYRSFTSAGALTTAYEKLLLALHPMIGSHGLAAAIYTQTTDVEVEVNGLMPYDRSSVKMDKERVRAANLQLYTPPPVVTNLLATSELEGREWSYTFEQPAEGWSSAGFDDGGWKRGPGGFGKTDNPGGNLRTEWATPDIWMRKTFTIPPEAVVERPVLRLHYDEDATVYINGVLAGRTEGHSLGYEFLSLTDEARAAVKPGENLIAVHCHQSEGGQFIDVGLMDFVVPVYVRPDTTGK